MPNEASLLQQYCSARGIPPPPPAEWAFYLALGLFRLLAILAGERTLKCVIAAIVDVSLLLVTTVL